MGLCKCPQRKVTELFCYEHRINVCEQCMVMDHSRCVVQTYLLWLQDYEYDNTCHFCKVPLEDPNYDAVRLLCLHVFHWQCFDNWAKQLPSNTAPAGYQCPICYFAVFPKPNQQSPIVDALKQKLSTTKWARAGLSLTALSEQDRPNSISMVHQKQRNTSVSPSVIDRNNSDMSLHARDTVVSIDAGKHADDEQEQSFAANRKSFQASGADTDSLLKPPLHRRDSDPVNKYKRRPPFEWLQRWLRSRPTITRSSVRCKRIYLYLLLVFLAILTIIVVFSRLGEWRVQSDPFSDLLANPNLRMADD